MAASAITTDPGQTIPLVVPGGGGGCEKAKGGRGGSSGKELEEGGEGCGSEVGEGSQERLV